MRVAKRAIALANQIGTTDAKSAARSAHMNELQRVYIVSACRTPIGSFRGALSSLPAPLLGSIAIKGALAYTNGKLTPTECLMGNVLSAGLGQAPARQAALLADLPVTTVSTTVNKVCSSGMKAVHYAIQSITLGLHSIVVAGGMESMSNAPYLLESLARNGGFGYGHQQLVDSVIKDGLWDAKYQIPMGECTERVAERYSISRADQDAYAVQSYKRSKKAISGGLFHQEIVPVTIKPAKKNQETTTVSEDEEAKRVDYSKIPTLKPAFRASKDGTVTAANSSSMSDGASALLLTSEQALKDASIKPLALIISYADAETDPCDFPLAPTMAIPLALKRAGLSIEEISLFEINEAFSAVIIANQKVLFLSTLTLC